jgi:hypothetical protein
LAATSSHPGRRLVAGAVLISFLLLPTPAFAGAQTLKRSFGNIVQAPIDMVLSPITAGMVQYKNMSNIEDSRGVRWFYAVPGYFWLLGLTLAASMLRLVAGVLEFLPGLVLLFTDAEMDPLFAPSDSGESVIWDYPTTVFDFKLGIDYTAAPF